MSVDIRVWHRSNGYVIVVNNTELIDEAIIYFYRFLFSLIYCSFSGINFNIYS